MTQRWGPVSGADAGHCSSPAGCASTAAATTLVAYAVPRNLLPEGAPRAPVVTVLATEAVTRRPPSRKSGRGAPGCDSMRQLEPSSRCSVKTGRAAAGDALSDGCPSGQTTESHPLSVWGCAWAHGAASSRIRSTHHARSSRDTDVELDALQKDSNER